MFDAFASYPHYWDHIQPIWEAAEDVGMFYVTRSTQRPGFVTNALGQGPAVLVAGFPDLKRTRHRPHIFLEHGIGETWGSTDPHYAGGPGRESVILFLCPNRRVAEANRRYDAPSVVVGSPRLEWLISSTPTHRERGDRLRLVASFHWDNRMIPETTTGLFQFQQYFAGWATDSRIEIRGHAHPRIIDKAAKYFARAGIEMIADFADVIAWADVYAADNTSTIFEARACGLGVVFFDLPWYPTESDSWRFGDHANIGPHVRDGRGLVEAAYDANDNRVSYDATGMVAEVFGTVDGSTRRAADAIRAVTYDNPRASSLPRPADP
jgi:hypothetical protein